MRVGGYECGCGCGCGCVSVGVGVGGCGCGCGCACMGVCLVVYPLCVHVCAVVIGMRLFVVRVHVSTCVRILSIPIYFTQ